MARPLPRPAPVTMEILDPVETADYTRKTKDALLARIMADLPDQRMKVSVHVPYGREDVIARIHREGRVLHIEHTSTGSSVDAEVEVAFVADLEDFLTEPVSSVQA